MASQPRYFRWSDSSIMDTTHWPSGWHQNTSSELLGPSTTSFEASNQRAYTSSSQHLRRGRFQSSRPASGDASKAHKPPFVVWLLGLSMLRHLSALIVGCATLIAGGLWLAS